MLNFDLTVFGIVSLLEKKIYIPYFIMIIVIYLSNNFLREIIIMLIKITITNSIKKV